MDEERAAWEARWSSVVPNPKLRAALWRTGQEISSLGEAEFQKRLRYFAVLAWLRDYEAYRPPRNPARPRSRIKGPEGPAYTEAHTQVRRERGRAAEYECEFSGRWPGVSAAES